MAILVTTNLMGHPSLHAAVGQNMLPTAIVAPPLLLPIQTVMVPMDIWVPLELHLQATVPVMRGHHPRRGIWIAGRVMTSTTLQGVEGEA